MSTNPLIDAQETLSTVTEGLETGRYTLHVETLPSGTYFHRVFGSKYGPLAFNDNSYALRSDYDAITDGSRFSPFPSAQTQASTLYFGESPRSALAETLLRSKPAGRENWLVIGDELVGRNMVECRTTFDLSLIKLRGTGLHGLGVDHQDLISNGPLIYPYTQAFACAIYQRSEAHMTHGMIWQSRLCSDEFAAMSWNRKLPSNWAEVVSVLKLDVDSDWRRWLFNELSILVG